jgi:hypothetical protein
MKKLIQQFALFSDKILLNENENSPPLQKALKSKAIYENYVAYFIEFESNISFKNQQDEILYFKKIKPEFLAHFIYLKKIIEIESSIHFVSSPNELLKSELEKINFFKTKHSEILSRYYIKNDESFDKNFNLDQCSKFVFDELLFTYSNDSINVKYDVIFAFFKAFEKIELYLFNKMNVSKKHNFEQLQIFLDEPITKTELSELTYAIHHLKCKNKTSIKEISTKLAFVFNVQNVNPYETFNEISNRVKNKSIFLDKLKNSLENKIQEKLSGY